MIAAMTRQGPKAIKSLALCAAIAEVDDPVRWLTDPPGSDDPDLGRLVDRLLADRTGERDKHVRTVERHIHRLEACLNVDAGGAYTSGQFGTQLCRLRKRFVDSARSLCNRFRQVWLSPAGHWRP